MVNKSTTRRQATKKTGMYRVTAVISMASKKMTSANANKLKAQIKRKSPKARVTISKA